MRIGVVDLDTSHPQNWIPIERELGHEVVGLWDGGAVHPRDYVAQFAKEHNVPEIYPSLEAMADDVDCAIIHGCDWDTHVDKARPFVEAGKGVLIDKPVAGTERDLRQLEAWANSGARITGGSSLRFCYETQRYLALPEAERGTPQTVLCGCGVDEFNYGIHAYAMLCGIMGPGIAQVQHLSTGGQHRVQATWDDGRIGYIVVGKAESWLPFYASITTEKAVTQYIADSGGLYRALLEATLPYLAGETATPPVPLTDVIEAERCALAARVSWLEGNRPVAIAELDPTAPGYDGAAFAVEYRKLKYP